MASLKVSLKSGTADHKATGNSEGMVQALVALATFCDRELRLKEEEGVCINGYNNLCLCGVCVCVYFLDIDSKLDSSVSERA